MVLAAAQLGERLSYVAGGPTHIVTSITTGFRGILTFTEETSDETKNSEVGGNLKVLIKVE